jgi:hypothetical protein
MHLDGAALIVCSVLALAMLEWYKKLQPQLRSMHRLRHYHKTITQQTR